MSNVAYQIHELLSTMNPTEKSYVKKTFSTNQKNMALLFDDLNKCTKFDRKTFLTRNKSRPYMKYLSQNCNYLLKNITKSLIDYNTENLTEINMLSRISSISLLIKKGMISASLHKIEREIELAEKYEYYEYGYKLIKLKERFYKIYFLKEFSHTTYIELAVKKKFYIDKLQLMDELDLLRAALLNTSLSIKEKLHLADEKFKELNISQVRNGLPLMAKIIYNFIKFKISELKGRPSYGYLKQSLVDFNDKNFLKGIYFESYFKVIANYLSGLINNRQYELFFKEYYKYRKELKGYDKWNSMRTSPFFYIVKYFTFIEASVKSMNATSALKKAKRYQQIITKTHTKLTDSLVSQAVQLNATVFFNTGHINETLDAIELLSKSKRIETQYFYKVMQLLCHYKLGNMMLVESLANSLATCLRKNKKEATLKDFLNLKKYLLNNDCSNLQQLEFLPYLDLNMLKSKAQA